jgi:sugar phosphate isomerase/epimerase
MSWPLSAFADEAGPTAEEQIAALRRAGLSFIDLRNIDGHNIAALPLDAAKTLRDKLAAANIRVGMYGSPIGKIDITEDLSLDLQKLRHLAALRPILGSSSVRIFSSFNKTNQPQPAYRAEAFRRLAELKKLAADLGLTLYHENELHIFGDFSADVLELAQTLRDATFRMIFDFGNYNAHHEDPWPCWLALRDTTDAIHIKDNAWTPEGTLIHTPAGLGGGKIPQILADAAARGWQGPVVVEPHLQHSAAVMATGPSGIANLAYANMPAAESFHLACQTAQEVIGKAQKVTGK